MSGINSNPLVSIVIPCYNHEKYVKDTIESVINQTYDNIELIIIDDGSTDNSVNIIEQSVQKCKERFVRFKFISQTNKGLSATLNKSLEWCKGDYFSCIASDDIILPKKTSIQVRYLNENNRILAVFGGMKLIDDNGNVIRELKVTNRTYNFEDIMLGDVTIYAPTQMIRTQCIRDVGGYNPDLLIEDYYMWLKLAEKGDLYCLSNCLSLYRKHGNNTSNQINKMYEGRLELLRYFQYSEYYEQAVSDVEWQNHLEQMISNKENRIYNFFYIIKTRPIKTLNLIVNKIVNKISH